MKNKQLITKILVVILFAICIIGSFAWYNDCLTDVIREQSIETIMELATKSAETMDVSVESELTYLRSLAKSLGSASEKQRRMLILQNFSDINENATVGIVDENGIGYINNGENIDIGNEDVFAQMQKGEVGITSVFYDLVSGERIILAYATFDEKGEKYKVFSGLNISKLYDYFDMPLYNGSGYTYLVDGYGNTIIRSTNTQSDKTFSNIFDVISETTASKKQVEQMQQAIDKGNSGYCQVIHNGQRVVISFAPIPNTENWSILLVVPERIILNSARHIFGHTAILATTVVGIILIIVYIFIELNKKLKSEKLRLSTIDPVTGHINYYVFKDELEKRLQNEQYDNCALVVLDIKNFKIINDTYGFQEGDKILKGISVILNTLVSPFVLQARRSSDTFVLFAENVNRDIIDEQYKKFKAVDIFQKYDLNFYCGVYLLDKEDLKKDVDALFDLADLAKKRAKADRIVDCVYYSESMRQEEVLNRELESQMESALANGEFVVYLQPKLNCKGGCCTSAEALVRWQHSERGLIPPNQFIPLFERNQFIVKLDRYVFENCCRLVSQWIIEGKPEICISVNISKVQIYRPDFLETYIGIKDKYNIPDHLLELEFTESIFFDDIPYLLYLITSLRGHGFLCSIDDFGKGYSSFSMLKDLPFDILKLDAAFFEGRCVEERDRLIVLCVVDMSRALSMKTVAEGIETQAEVEFLKQINCDYIQGYTFARPMPISEFEEKFLNAEGSACEYFEERYVTYEPALAREYDRALRSIYDELYQLNFSKNSYRIVYHTRDKYVSPPEEGRLDEAIKQIASNMVYPEDRKQFLEFWDIENIRTNLADHNDTVMLEVRKKCFDGSYRWATLTVCRVENFGGNEVYLCFVMDIEKSKMAEEAIEKSAALIRESQKNERYKIIAEQIGLLIFDYSLSRDRMYYVINDKSGNRVENIIDNYTAHVLNSKVLSKDCIPVFTERMKRACSVKVNESFEFWLISMVMALAGARHIM